MQVLILSSTWTGLCLLPHLRKRNAELQSRMSLILNNEPLGLRCFEQKESSETHFLLYFLDEANGVLLWQKTIRRMFSLPARSTFPAVASYQKELQQTRIELILSKTYHTSLTHPFTVLLESFWISRSKKIAFLLSEFSERRQHNASILQETGKNLVELPYYPFRRGRL